MAYINLFIENECSLKVKNNQLIINNMDNSYPLEDINSIIIDNIYTNLSTYLINKICENNIMLYCCNEKHLPTVQILTVNSYVRKFKKLKEQIAIAKPLQKRLWQQIIIQKIINQARCLELLGFSEIEYNTLIDMSNRVQSGDITNIEANAAQYYFKTLYGKTFTRSDENIINSSLNYGYAIIRGMISRSLIAHGLEPSIGLFHHNELNNFNLCDDLIEPFRPFVDLYITKSIPRDSYILDKEVKTIILNIVNQIIIIDNKKYNMQMAIEYMVMSLSKSITEREIYIQLPGIQKLQEYKFL